MRIAFVKIGFDSGDYAFIAYIAVESNARLCAFKPFQKKIAEFKISSTVRICGENRNARLDLFFDFRYAACEELLVELCNDLICPGFQSLKKSLRSQLEMEGIDYEKT